jgi:hypothetical protein
LAKRLSDIQKKEIVKYFRDGQGIDQLANNFNFTKLTIVRNLKKILGEQKFQELNSQIISKKEIELAEENSNIYIDQIINPEHNALNHEPQDKNKSEKGFYDQGFVEITPLNLEIENAKREDFSSIPISEIEFPKVVYMIVNSKIELETKFLNDFPLWQFLPKEDLNRKTFEIYDDLKNAKRFCNKNQKVIKVPNTNVFEIAAPILLSRGISRIVSDDKLIALEK